MIHKTFGIEFLTHLHCQMTNKLRKNSKNEVNRSKAISTIHNVYIYKNLENHR